MTGPVGERVTAVLADGRQGSGYLLTPYLVLTASHVVRDSEDIRAAVPGGSGEIPCGLLWPLRNDDLDVALLVAREDLAPAAGFPPMRWAKPDTLDLSPPGRGRPPRTSEDRRRAQHQPRHGCPPASCHPHPLSLPRC